MRRALLNAFVLACLAGIVLSSILSAAETDANSGSADYLQAIKPILQSHCFACHGALKQEGGLRLDSVRFMRRGGDGGAALVPGNAVDSLLIQRITTADESLRMPAEGGPLSAKQIQLLQKWIDAGAAAPANEPQQKDPRKHWAFQKLERPAVPRLANSQEEACNPIDSFLMQRRRQHGLNPIRPAARHELLRRVFLDLTGLPPTRQQLVEFLNDESPQAYDHFVDRLLNSPQYGVRWGRHWMDVWRYSDWYGKRPGSLRHSHPHIWRWRDWIIDSLNEDKGYDQMILEMIAGDEVAGDDARTVRATGFLVRNWNIHNRNVWLRETVEHVGKAFLGLTLECARCHDHKFDPISQKEYYEFRAFFEPHALRIDRVPGEMDIDKTGLTRIYDAHLDRKTYLYLRGDDRRPVKSQPLVPGVPGVLATDRLQLQPIALSVTTFYPTLRPWVTKQLVAEAERKRDRARQLARAAESSPADSAVLASCEFELANKKLAALRRRIVAERAKFGIVPADKIAEFARQASRAERRVAVAESSVTLCRAKQHLASLQNNAVGEDEATAEQFEEAKTGLRRAEQLHQQVLRDLEVDSRKYTPLGKIYPKISSGRRLALARWMMDSQNPLTARVAVNHIWLRHFGEPLVQSVFDFGLNGSQPTHPRLLDWLAAELIQNGWSMKHLHRLIVTSAAYRMSSSVDLGDRDTRQRDPENRLLWRMHRRRMEAELVRDSLLFLAGQLSHEMKGPELTLDGDASSNRRSVYLLHTRDDRMLLLRLFDAASVEQCYRRRPSIVPHQALALANSPLVLESARLLAAQLSSNARDNAEFVGQAFQQVLCRDPSPAEKRQCEGFLGAQAKLLGDAGRLTAFATGPVHRIKAASDPLQRAREDLVQVLFNHNDFVTIR